MHDLKSATAAITEITQQGEGATVPQPPMPGEEPFGGYLHYGQRLDGTYGPVLGTPWELSHYRKFQRIADGDVPLPDIYPMRPDPSDTGLDGAALRLSHLFDACYTLVLTTLEQSFNSARTSGFFRVSFPVMQVALPSLATLLMQTPILPAADPDLGPTAGPQFAYRPQPLAEMAAEAASLLAGPPDLGTGYRQLWSHGIGRATEALAGALAEPVLGGQ